MFSIHLASLLSQACTQMVMEMCPWRLRRGNYTVGLLRVAQQNIAKADLVIKGTLWSLQQCAKQRLLEIKHAGFQTLKIGFAHVF